MKAAFSTFLILYLAFSAGTAFAESNLPPPESADSPFVTIGDDNSPNEDATEGSESDAISEEGEKSSPFDSSDRSERRPSFGESGSSTGGEAPPQDIFRKVEKVLPTSHNPLAPSPEPPGFSIDWESGGNFSAALECGRFIVLSSYRVIHVWDKDTLKERGEFDIGKPIGRTLCRVSEGREFLLVLTASPVELSVFDISKSPLVVPKPLPNGFGKGMGDIQVFKEGVFVERSGMLFQYDLSASGTLEERAKIPLPKGDLYYPSKSLFYFYRSRDHRLEVWNQKRDEILSSLDLGGTLVPLLLVDEAGKRDEAGRVKVTRSFLYFLVKGTGSEAYTSLYQVPVHPETGLFLEMGRDIPFPSAIREMSLDASKGLFFAKLPEKGGWWCFDLKSGKPLRGEIEGTVALVPSEGSGLYLASPTQLKNVEFVRGADDQFSLRPVVESKPFGGSERLYLSPKGDRLDFLSRGRGFEVLNPGEGVIPHKLFDSPSLPNAELKIETSYWFLEDVKSGKLYVADHMDSPQATPKWQEIRFPGVDDAADIRHVRHTIKSRSDGHVFDIWVAATFGDGEGGTRGSIGLYTLSFAPQAADAPRVPTLSGPSLQSTDFIEIFEVIPLSADNQYLAVAAGGEGIVILGKEGRGGEVTRIHKRAEWSPFISCERLYLSPKREVLIATFRDTRIEGDPRAALNLYDVASEVRFPIFLSQLTDLPLVVQGEGLEVPKLTFARGGSLIALALGEEGLGLLNIANPAMTEFRLEDLGPNSVTDVDTAKAGEMLCLSGQSPGLTCGHFK